MIAVRISENGLVDRGFGDAGVAAAAPVTGEKNSVARDVALDSLGGVGLTGIADTSGTEMPETVITSRFDSEGSRDTSFGSDGTRELHPGAGFDPAGSRVSGSIVATQDRLVNVLTLRRPEDEGFASSMGFFALRYAGEAVGRDERPPQTTIVQAPRRTTSRRRAGFSFTADENGSRFQCRIDRQRWRRCVSPKVMRRVDRGLHVFRVRAIDRAGNVDATPAAARWRVRRR